ncbi:MAG TPA: MmgE/PrpD family protein [Burkholderiales bacterium]|nr:MmgE/PrpD family protein [Burkholderiales bacterium]
MTASATLGAFCASLRWEDIPPPVRDRAKHLILDAVGCGLAARRFDFAAPALRAAAELGAGGERVVLGQPARLSLRDAVLANGILMHGLDYDDTHTEGIVHLTVSVLPAALGVAAERGLHGRELLAAYVAGVEAGARIAAAARGAFHQVGFHPTGVVGAFACAITAGKLYGLDAESLGRAQGIALSVAAGSLEFLEDGSWTKRFHPGWAAVGGITAAIHAGHGFVAPPAAYEGRFGLYRSYLGALEAQCDRARVTRGLGQEWETLQVAVKPYPACHFVHAFADAAIALHAAGVRAQDVERITALVPAEVVKTVCEPQSAKRRPANDYDARFSVPYVIAAALRAGQFGLAELEEGPLRDPQTLALAAKVDYAVDPDSTFPKHYCGEVIVRTKAGREHRHREGVNRGCAERPLSSAEVEAKFAGNAAFGGATERGRPMRDAILSLDAHPARALEDTLAAG